MKAWTRPTPDSPWVRYTQAGPVPEGVELVFSDSDPNGRKPRKVARKAVARPLSKKQVEQVLSCDNLKYRAMLSLQWSTGMRPGEICALRTADMFLDDGKLVVPRSGKTGERWLYLNAKGRTAQTVREYLGAEPAGEYVFGDVKEQTFYTFCHRLGEKLGFHLDGYSCRHVYADDQHRNGATLIDLAAALGHSVTTLTTYYLAPSEEAIRMMNADR